MSVKKVPKIICTQKRKIEDFFGEVFLKVWKFAAQSTKLKKPSPSEKSTKTLFCTRILLCWENCRIFFCSILDKKCSGSSKKISVTKKNKNVLFHALNTLLETLLKIVLPKLERLSSQSKKPKSLRKKFQIVLWMRKLKHWDFCWRSFAQSLDVFRSKYMTKKTFHLEKTPSCSFAQVFCTFEVGANYFYFKLREIFVRGPRKMVLFWGKKQPGRFSAHLEFTFKNTAETFLVDAWVFCSHSPKKNVVIWEKRYRNVFWTWKKKNWDFCRRSFALSTKVFHSKYRK